MPDQTMLQIAADTHKAVLALQEFIEREVPSRTELHAKRKQGWTIIAGITVLSLLFGFVGTITTVSACFIGGDVRKNGTVKHSDVCGLMPGYNESVDSQEDLLMQFKELIEITTRNEQRISRLERRAEN